MSANAPSEHTESNNHSDITPFIEQISTTLAKQTFTKLLLSNYKGKEADLKRITIRSVQIKNESVLSFVYTYQTNDITKNFSHPDALTEISSLLQSDFKNANFYANDFEGELRISKKGKVSFKTKRIKDAQSSQNETVNNDHNREKKRFVDINRPFLTALGVTDQQQKLIPAMSRKWKQINKFIEVFSQALSTTNYDNNKPVNVVDFGSGKGYLTFAIHDYLRHELKNEAQVTGVELRKKLADLCNNASNTLNLKGLDFVCGDVKTHAPEHTDVMIALHACDVATDYAIHYGIRAEASIIMCSPCCHKQIRPQMENPQLKESVMNPMLKFGVHLGQQAEMVTDSLRALFLEANGYQTKVFEFISLEHTNKNKMIMAVKNKDTKSAKAKAKQQAVLAQIEEIKKFYGIEEHCLETLLNEGH